MEVVTIEGRLFDGGVSDRGHLFTMCGWNPWNGERFPDIGMTFGVGSDGEAQAITACEKETTIIRIPMGDYIRARDRAYGSGSA